MGQTIEVAGLFKLQALSLNLKPLRSILKRLLVNFLYPILAQPNHYTCFSV
jgi:hypothetical protein